MAIKEKMKEFGGKAKRFWKEHWKGICLVGGGLTLTGAILYGLHKSGSDDDEDAEPIDSTESMATIEDKTAWNKDWDEIGCELEFITRQPHGPFRDGDFVDILDGNCFIIAGPNSFYNDDPELVEYMVLDKEGWYHYLPEDVHYA